MVFRVSRSPTTLVLREIGSKLTFLSLRVLASDIESIRARESNINTAHKYDKDFLSKEQSDALFAVAKTLPSEQPLTKLSGFRNRLRRLQMPCYSTTPNWRGSENEKRTNG